VAAPLALLGSRVSLEYKLALADVAALHVLLGCRVSLEYKLTLPDVAAPLAPELRSYEPIVSQAVWGRLQLGLPRLKQGEEYRTLDGDLGHPRPLQQDG